MNSELEQLQAKVKRLTNAWLLELLRGETGEGHIANLLDVEIIDVRAMMNERYGEDWRAAADDSDLLIQKMAQAGDFDDLPITIPPYGD